MRIKDSTKKSINEVINSCLFFCKLRFKLIIPFKNSFKLAGPKYHKQSCKQDLKLNKKVVTVT